MTEFADGHMTVSAAAATGDHLLLLRTLRAHIATQLDEGVPARELAALTRRLHELSKEIAALQTDREGDPIDAAANAPALADDTDF